MLIDTGLAREKDKIIDNIKSIVKEESIENIDLFITHTHIDHVENLITIAELFKPCIYIGKEEKGNIDEMACPVIEIERDTYLSNYWFDILQTPGHTSGSISLYYKSEFAIIGDCGLLSGRKKYIKDRILEESVKKLVDLKCNIYIPSHGKFKTYEEFESEYSNK